jgi:hypothetical protein
VNAPYPRAAAEVLRATANDLADWLGSSDLMADEISDHGIDVILRWLRERASQVEREVVHPTPLAAVSAAAPDERWWESLVQAECEVGHVIFMDDGDGTVYACPACALAEARAALAARPAPTVSGEAVEAAARRLYVRTAKDNTTHDEAVVPWADLHPYAKDRWLDYARDALTAALGLTVADGAGTPSLTPEWIAAHERDHIDAYEEVDGTCVSVADLRAALGLTVADEGRAEA